MSAPTLRSGRLLQSPVVRRDGRWWLVSGAGAVPATGPSFTKDLDAFAIAVAAADRAVAGLRSQPMEPAAAFDGREWP